MFHHFLDKPKTEKGWYFNFEGKSLLKIFHPKNFLLDLFRLESKPRVPHIEYLQNTKRGSFIDDSKWISSPKRIKLFRQFSIY